MRIIRAFISSPSDAENERKRAVRVMSRAQVNARIAEAYATRGAELLKEGKDEMALSQFSIAISRDAGLAKRVDDLQADVYYYRGLKAFKEGKDQDAKALFDQAIAHVPSLAERVDAMWASAFALRGAKLFAEGKDQEAREQLLKAVERQPRLASELERTWTNLLITRGMKQFENDASQETNASLDQALQRDPDAADRINTGKAMIYLGRGRKLLDGEHADSDGDARTEEAIAILEKSLKLIPLKAAENKKRGMVLLHIGRAFLEKRLFGEALERFREAKSLGDIDAPGWARSTALKLAKADYEKGHIEDAFLISAEAYIDADPNEEGIPIDPVIFHSLGDLYRQAQESKNTAAISECDRLASDSTDPLGVGPGAKLSELEQSNAIAACTTAIRDKPDEPRFRFNLARSYSRAADIFRAEKNEQKAYEADGLSLSELEGVAAKGYPWAFIYAATNYFYGRGTNIDLPHGRSLVLQGLTHTLHCCWVPVARHLLTMQPDHNPDSVRRVVREMTEWAAQLGSDEATALFAELTGRDLATVTASLPRAAFTDPPPWLKSRLQTQN